MRMNLHGWGDATRAIHGGENKHGVGVPVTPPIVRSSTFTFRNTAEMRRWAEGKSKAYIYTRYGNPTLSVAESKLAALEGGQAAVVTASGMPPFQAHYWPRSKPVTSSSPRKPCTAAPIA